MRTYQINFTQTLRNDYKVYKRLPSIKLPWFTVLRVLLDKPPDNEISTVWGQFLFGYIINSTYPGGLPKVKSLDLGACTVP